MIPFESRHPMVFEKRTANLSHPLPFLSDVRRSFGPRSKLGESEREDFYLPLAREETSAEIEKRKST